MARLRWYLHLRGVPGWVGGRHNRRDAWRRARRLARLHPEGPHR